MISVSNITMRYGAKVLFEEVSTTFLPAAATASPAQRRRQIHLHEDPRRATSTPKGQRHPPQKVRRPAAGPVRLRRLPRHRHRHHGQQAASGPPSRNAKDSTKSPNSPTKTACASANSKASSAKKTATPPKSDAAVLLDGLDIPESLHERKMGELQGGQKSASCSPRRSSANPGPPARRAHQQPRSRLHPLAPGFPLPFRGNPDRHLARPPLPQLGLHPHRRHRLPDHHHLHRRLRRHGAGQDPDPFPPRI